MVNGESLLGEKQLNKIAKECVAFFGGRIEAIVLFGSRARGDYTEQSDFDVCIIGDLLEKEKTKVYSFFPNEIDLSFFDELPLPIKIRVFGEGRFIFVRDWDSIYKLHSEVLRDYEDIRVLLSRKIFERFEKCLT